MRRYRKAYFSVILIVSLACNPASDKHQDENSAAGQTADEDNSQPALTARSQSLPLDKIKLPPGFVISKRVDKIFGGLHCYQHHEPGRAQSCF